MNRKAEKDRAFEVVKLFQVEFLCQSNLNMLLYFSKWIRVGQDGKRIASVVIHHRLLSFRKLQNNSEREIYNLVDYLNVIAFFILHAIQKKKKKKKKSTSVYIRIQACIVKSSFTTLVPAREAKNAHTGISVTGTNLIA